VIPIQLTDTDARRLERASPRAGGRKYRGRLQVVRSAHRRRACQDIAADRGLAPRTVRDRLDAHPEGGPRERAEAREDWPDFGRRPKRAIRSRRVRKRHAPRGCRRPRRPWASGDPGPWSAPGAARTYAVGRRRGRRDRSGPTRRAGMPSPGRADYPPGWGWAGCADCRRRPEASGQADRRSVGRLLAPGIWAADRPRPVTRRHRAAPGDAAESGDAQTLPRRPVRPEAFVPGRPVPLPGGREASEGSGRRVRLPAREPHTTNGFVNESGVVAWNLRRPSRRRDRGSRWGGPIARGMSPDRIRSTGDEESEDQACPTGQAATEAIGA